MLTFHFTNIFFLLLVYKNQGMCIYILLTKLTCQFVENFPASFYSQFEQVFQCTEIKYTQILKNGQFGFRKFMQQVFTFLPYMLPRVLHPVIKGPPNHGYFLQPGKIYVYVSSDCYNYQVHRPVYSVNYINIFTPHHQIFV